MKYLKIKINNIIEEENEENYTEKIEKEIIKEEMEYLKEITKDVKIDLQIGYVTFSECNQDNFYFYTLNKDNGTCYGTRFKWNNKGNWLNIIISNVME